MTLKTDNAISNFTVNLRRSFTSTGNFQKVLIWHWLIQWHLENKFDLVKTKLRWNQIGLQLKIISIKINLVIIF